MGESRHMRGGDRQVHGELTGPLSETAPTLVLAASAPSFGKCDGWMGRQVL